MTDNRHPRTEPKGCPAPITLRRRGFMASTGAALAGTTLGAAAAPANARADAALRVGLLLPQSTAYPALGSQLLHGMRTEAKAEGVRLHITAVEYGQFPNQAQAAAQRLLEDGAVDVLVGYVCANAAAQWTPLLERHATPLLVCDAGANALAPHARSAWVARNSLGHWQAAWATGRWAARQLGPRALVALGPADGGFDHLPAFAQGLASAEGRVAAIEYTHAADGTERLATLSRRVRQERPDFVHALVSGRQAEAFARFWRSEGLGVPLVASGMAGEALAAIPMQSGGWAAPVHAVRPWATAPAALPTPFALLGAEAVQRLALAAAKRPGARGLEWAQALAAATPVSPRGPVANDAATGETVAAAYVHALSHSRKGQSLAAQVLPAVPLAQCQGLCERLGSRVLGAYLAA